jgi:hypothetical protein
MFIRKKAIALLVAGTMFSALPFLALAAGASPAQAVTGPPLGYYYKIAKQCTNDPHSSFGPTGSLSGSIGIAESLGFAGLAAGCS